MELIKTGGKMYVDINCCSTYGPMTLRLSVDPTPGKKLRRILSASVVTPPPDISVLTELTGLMDEISTKPAESLVETLAKQQRFSLAIAKMAELSRGE